MTSSRVWIQEVLSKMVVGLGGGAYEGRWEDEEEEEGFGEEAALLSLVVKK